MLRALAFLLAFLPAAALGQQGVRQSGNVSPGHVACWTTSGIIQDCGIASAPFANVFGLVGTGTGAPFFIDTSPTTGPFNQFVAGFDSGKFYLSLTALGGATHIPLDFIVNGNVGLTLTDTGVTIAGGSTGGAVPTVGSGSGDCGTSPAIAGNSSVGRVTVGSSANGGKCTVTFAAPYPHAPACYTQDETANARLTFATTTSATLVINAATTFTAADSLVYSCAGYN